MEKNMMMCFCFRNVWDGRVELMCPRATSGAFECSFDPSMPFIADKHYTEGNAWQWTWAVGCTSVLVLTYYSPAHLCAPLAGTRRSSRSRPAVRVASALLRSIGGVHVEGLVAP
jgi:hypothetical protein